MKRQPSIQTFAMLIIALAFIPFGFSQPPQPPGAKNGGGGPGKGMMRKGPNHLNGLHGQERPDRQNWQERGDRGERGERGERRFGPGGPGHRGEFNGGKGRGRGGPPPVVRLLERLEIEDPELHAKFMAMRQDDPDTFFIEVRKHMMSRLGKDNSSRPPKPAMNLDDLKAIRDAAKACRQERTADNEQKLKNLLRIAFDNRQNAQRERIQQMEEDLAALRKLVADREVSKEETLSNHFQAILAMEQKPVAPESDGGKK